jgi:cytidylate kinase
LPIQKQVIRQPATKDCIIVGRCADVILADLNPFRLFVYADEESKLKRCRARQTEEESLMSDKKLIKKMRRIDKGRRKMHDLFLGKPWGNREGYDLCVNTSGVEVKEVVPCIAEYINRWYKDKE